MLDDAAPRPLLAVPSIRILHRRSNPGNLGSPAGPDASSNRRQSSVAREELPQADLPPALALALPLAFGLALALA